MQNASVATAGDFSFPSAEWTTERLHSWKEIASFFGKEVRTVQLWEKSEGLPVRRQHHKKLGSVYAYRRELESWWITRSALSGRARVACAKPSQANTAGTGNAEFGRILLFPFEVVHSRLDRGPLQQIVNRFAGGLMEDLNLELSRSRFDPVCLSLGALPMRRASSPGFMRDVAREFGSECYLTGAVRYAGNLVRVSIQLVRNSDSVCLWSERFDTALDNILRAHAELAHKIVQAFPAHILRCGLSSQRPCAADDGPAYNACMLGLYFRKQRTKSSLLKALEYFRDAILIDPSCADAHAGLTDTYVSLSYNHFMPAREAMEAAQRSIAAALSLEPKSITVRNAEVNFKKCCTWDWQAAERVCRQIVDSGSVEPRTLRLYADLMINRGRHDDAISLALHAHRLNPLSASANSQVSFAYFYAGDYDNAIPFIEQTITLKPLLTIGHALLGRTEAQRGNWNTAIESFERGLALSGDSTFLKALLAYGYAGRGDTVIASDMLREIEERRGDACYPAVDVSAVYAILNQENKALESIYKAYDLRDVKVTYIRYDPRFTRLRALPQFQEIASSFCDRAG